MLPNRDPESLMRELYHSENAAAPIHLVPRTWLASFIGNQSLDFDSRMQAAFSDTRRIKQ